MKWILLKVLISPWLKSIREKRLVCVISDFKRPEFTQVGLSCKPVPSGEKPDCTHGPHLKIKKLDAGRIKFFVEKKKSNFLGRSRFFIWLVMSRPFFIVILKICLTFTPNSK